ncbi:hypothetical protein FB565_008211 [Actinoplanes lutulentus]|uniref:Uncharacterized protein n=1 Tax=Actinoplanes lutulentus TaxID=1287878 RepID=A0A327Z867_9ACTN|nr:hypothetical protein [Actinoplanes lutulentus]RAK34539.1 hypothetical protein B0I29_111138 [Actinoplanes lutulentus]
MCPACARSHPSTMPCRPPNTLLSPARTSTHPAAPLSGYRRQPAHPRRAPLDLEGGATGSGRSREFPPPHRPQTHKVPQNGTALPAHPDTDANRRRRPAHPRRRRPGHPQQRRTPHPGSRLCSLPRPPRDRKHEPATHQSHATHRCRRTPPDREGGEAEAGRSREFPPPHRPQTHKIPENGPPTPPCRLTACSGAAAPGADVCGAAGCRGCRGLQGVPRVAGGAAGCRGCRGGASRSSAMSWGSDNVTGRRLAPLGRRSGAL